MSIKKLFSAHISVLRQEVGRILAEGSFEGLVISSGSPFVYFADDQEAPFRVTPHFAHWCPDGGAHHLLHIQPGKKPRLIRYAPADFWYEHTPLGDAFWCDEFDITEVAEKQDLARSLGQLKGHAFIGPELEWAEEQGFTVNPPQLLAPLDWGRGLKSAYEVHCIEEANRIASLGHYAARAAFLNDASELGIHQAYLQAVGCTEVDLPYGTIVALDAKSAVLHYQNKRSGPGGGVLLIDAGVRRHSYASDITRTYVRKGAPAVFGSMLACMEDMQQHLCTLVTKDVSYLRLHDESHQLIAQILIDHDILKGCSAEEAIAKNFTKAFFPHGLGHMLGIQVHDVSGRQKNAQGDPCPPSAKYPQLRTVRPLRTGEVITMEPGLYFIEVLLAPWRQKGEAEHFNFKLISELLPWGGIRIEDNLVVEDKGCRNLTRQFLQNDFLC